MINLSINLQTSIERTCFLTIIFRSSIVVIVVSYQFQIVRKFLLLFGYKRFYLKHTLKIEFYAGMVHSNWGEYLFPTPDFCEERFCSKTLQPSLLHTHAHEEVEWHSDWQVWRKGTTYAQFTLIFLGAGCPQTAHLLPPLLSVTTWRAANSYIRLPSIAGPLTATKGIFWLLLHSFFNCRSSDERVVYHIGWPLKVLKQFPIMKA